MMKNSPAVLDATFAICEETVVNSHCCKPICEKLFTLKEVANHCDTLSCWVVVDNVVYDLTNFLFEHPGGCDIILEHAGRDCTIAFQDKGHSTWAAQLLEKYRIGMLQEHERITL